MREWVLTLQIIHQIIMSGFCLPTINTNFIIFILFHQSRNSLRNFSLSTHVTLVAYLSSFEIDREKSAPCGSLKIVQFIEIWTLTYRITE